MDDYLVGEYLEREVRNKGLASFLDRANIEFHFTNVFADGSGVVFHHISFVFNLIKFLVHHHDSDNEFGVGKKANYFC
jgi:hypothetical protein